MHYNLGSQLMPTLQRFGAVSLRMYADDHRPPHFHVVGPDFEVLVRIADLSVIAGQARPAQVAEARHGQPGKSRSWLRSGLS